MLTGELVIIGAGGNAGDILDAVEALNREKPTWTVRGVLDDKVEVVARPFGLEVLGRVSDAPRLGDVWFINAIGSDRSYLSRPRVLVAAGVPPERFATIIHPGASVSSRAKVGRGVFISHAATIAGNVQVADHVMAGAGCIVGHDSMIEQQSVLAPGAVISGFVRIGRCCYVGAGAMVRQRVNVGEGALIGAGAVVLNDVAPRSIVVGNPARVLEREAVRADRRTSTEAYEHGACDCGG